ncbi:MAG: hypothetical protein KDB22_28590 [Planctomycetales bacterium]|nr:hypothetical protein [Planctomycetales bacterium]
MNSLTLLEIPESDAQRPAWLEQQLVGTKLGDLVQQLRFVREQFPHSSPALVAETDLDTFLSDERDAVLQSGLAPLGERRLHALLQNPDLLLALQEFVLMHGGAYWTELIQQSTEVLKTGTAENRVTSASIDFASKRNERLVASEGKQDGRRIQQRRTWLWASMAAAACVLVVTGIALNRSGNDRSSGWGFNNPDLFSTQATSSEYFASLANAANQWFDKPTPDSIALQKRLGEFSHGCAALIEAKHQPLSEPERAWLVAKCRDWKSKIDLLQTQLAAGNVSLEEGAAQAKELVDRMVSALRTESQQV